LKSFYSDLFGYIFNTNSIPNLTKSTLFTLGRDTFHPHDSISRDKA